MSTHESSTLVKALHQEPAPIPSLLCDGTLAPASTQHNKASGSDIPVSEPVHTTEAIQHSTCFHTRLLL